MTVFGISMVRDEADIIESTIRHMLHEVDELIVIDNGSVDGTREILAEIPITVLDDPDPAYYQSEKMSALAQQARQRGADWVVPFDADEWWVADGRIGDVLARCDSHIVTAALFDHVATPDDQLGWRRREGLGLPKVAVRALPGLTIHQGNHGAALTGVRRPRVADGLLTVHHFPYRSPEQFISKVRNGAAAYAATDLPEGVGVHWRQYGRILDEDGEQGLIDLFNEHFFVEDPEDDPALVFDPVR